MSEEKDNEKPKKNVMQDIMMFSRKVNTLPKVVDFISDEVIPTLFRGQVKEIYSSTAKAIDSIIRNI